MIGANLHLLIRLSVCKNLEWITMDTTQVVATEINGQFTNQYNHTTSERKPEIYIIKKSQQSEALVS